MLSCWIWSKYARLKRINLEFIFEKGLFCFKLLISVDYVNVIEMLRDKAGLCHDTFWRNLVNYEWRRWCTLWVKLISPCLIGVSIRLIVATIPRHQQKEKGEVYTLLPREGWPKFTFFTITTQWSWHPDKFEAMDLLCFCQPGVCE